MKTTLRTLTEAKTDDFTTRAFNLRKRVDKLLADYEAARGINEDNVLTKEVEEDQLRNALLQAVSGLEEFFEVI